MKMQKSGGPVGELGQVGCVQRIEVIVKMQKRSGVWSGGQDGCVQRIN